MEVRKGIIEDLPVDSESVDFLISNCVINLSPDKPKVFEEIARVLKPGGSMSVSDIVVRDLPDWIRSSKALYSSCVAGAVSEEEYITGLEAAGMTDVEVKERLVYDTTQLRAFIKSEIPGVEEALSCCGGAGEPALSDEIVAKIAEAVEGKIWSAKFAARKG